MSLVVTHVVPSTYCVPDILMGVGFRPGSPWPADTLYHCPMLSLIPSWESVPCVIVGNPDMAIYTISTGFLDQTPFYNILFLWEPDTACLCPADILFTKEWRQELPRLQHVKSDGNINLSFQPSWFWKTGSRVFPSLSLQEQSLPSQSSKPVLALYAQYTPPVGSNATSQCSHWHTYLPVPTVREFLTQASLL